MIIEIPEFEEKTQLFDWLITNKTSLMTQKKMATKFADAISFAPAFVHEKGDSVIKAEAIPQDSTKIKVRSIINTTKLYDSHGDVHIDQLWNKSLKETQDFYLVKEHNFTFDGIISDNVKAFVKQMNWSELGFNYAGQTQALVFDSVISKAESPDMFDRYRTGKVKQHSVGMRYVKIDLAINDDRYDKEYALWQKYYDMIVNKDDVNQNGYFWPVTEAKAFEGSAVVRASNFATPTTSVQETKSQPPSSTDSEPLKDTRLMEALNKLLIKI